MKGREEMMRKASSSLHRRVSALLYSFSGEAIGKGERYSTDGRGMAAEVLPTFVRCILTTLLVTKVDEKTRKKYVGSVY